MLTKWAIALAAGLLTAAICGGMVGMALIVGPALGLGQLGSLLLAGATAAGGWLLTGPAWRAYDRWTSDTVPGAEVGNPGEARRGAPLASMLEAAGRGAEGIAERLTPTHGPDDPMERASRRL